MPRGDKRADYGAGAPLPPELDPRRGRPSKAQQQLRVSDLQARNPAAPTRGRHRPGGGGAEPDHSSRAGRHAPADAVDKPRTGNLRRGSLMGGRIVIAMLSIAALLGSDSIAGATPAEVTALGTTPDRTDAATDTMMIMHVPADGKKATIISFPRDSWVTIPGHGQDKINAAYIDCFNDAASQGATDILTKQSAAIEMAAQTLSNLTGLHIDHYVQVNLLGFYEISEASGGVDLCLN